MTHIVCHAVKLPESAITCYSEHFYGVKTLVRAVACAHLIDVLPFLHNHGQDKDKDADEDNGNDDDNDKDEDNDGDDDADDDDDDDDDNNVVTG